MSAPYYLGIDLGTSAVKGILRAQDGRSAKFRESYQENTPDGWRVALRALIAHLRQEAPGNIAAIGLSSQVGTYLVDGREIISWQSGAGREELDEIRDRISRDEFLQEIAMDHPALVSYPLPRLQYIQRHFGDGREVLMPKEFILRVLTGNALTDRFSMRGIVHTENGQYASALLKKLGITAHLPPVGNPWDRAGEITREAAIFFGLEAGTPVYLGCNDFFAGLLGMGVYQIGDAFDLSGTSEHIGYISQSINPRGFVSGPYFAGFCTYGGTKSSGTSCRFAMDQFGIDDLSIGEMLQKNPPIFLPYLEGERAPIFDDNARGVYFGLSGDTDRRQMAYAALEGVVFSLYHIAKTMDLPIPRRMICGGGSAENALMNLLRATLFGCEIWRVTENDPSALGACMLAMTGHGAYHDLTSAIAGEVTYAQRILPVPALLPQLQKRFAIYQELYGALKDSFRHFREIGIHCTNGGFK